MCACVCSEKPQNWKDDSQRSPAYEMLSHKALFIYCDKKHWSAQVYSHFHSVNISPLASFTHVLLLPSLLGFSMHLKLSILSSLFCWDCISNLALWSISDKHIMFRQRHKIRLLPLHSNTPRRQNDKDGNTKQSTTTARRRPVVAIFYLRNQDKLMMHIIISHLIFLVFFFIFMAIQGNPMYKVLQINY